LGAVVLPARAGTVGNRCGNEHFELDSGQCTCPVCCTLATKGQSKWPFVMRSYYRHPDVASGPGADHNHLPATRLGFVCHRNRRYPWGWVSFAWGLVGYGQPWPDADVTAGISHVPHVGVPISAFGRRSGRLPWWATLNTVEVEGDLALTSACSRGSSIPSRRQACRRATQFPASSSCRAREG